MRRISKTLACRKWRRSSLWRANLSVRHERVQNASARRRHGGRHARRVAREAWRSRQIRGCRRGGRDAKGRDRGRNLSGGRRLQHPRSGRRARSGRDSSCADRRRRGRHASARRRICRRCAPDRNAAVIGAGAAKRHLRAARRKIEDHARSAVARGGAKSDIATIVKGSGVEGSIRLADVEAAAAAQSSRSAR